MKKKVVAIVSAMCLAFTLAGCSGGFSSSKAVDIAETTLEEQAHKQFGPNSSSINVAVGRGKVVSTESSPTGTKAIVKVEMVINAPGVVKNVPYWLTVEYSGGEYKVTDASLSDPLN